MNKDVFDPMAWVSQNNANTVNEPVKTDAPVKNPQPVVPPCGNELDKVEAVVVELERLGGPSDSYKDWYCRTGFALADGLGDAGREFFFRVSRLSPKFNERECEKKWQECRSKHDGRTQLSAFYNLAKEAGVDLSAISRRFPSAEFTSKPHLPHGYEENCNQQGLEGDNDINDSDYQVVKNNSSNSDTASSNNEYSREVNEVLRFSFSQTFTQKLDKGKLPVTIQRCLEELESAEEQDKTMLAVLDLLAIAQPNVYGIYHGKRVYTPFYLFILGLAGISHKGAIDDLKHLLTPIVHAMLSQYYAQLAEYKEQHDEWEAKKSQRGKSGESAGTEPEEPQYRSLFVSADSSAAAFKLDLYNNGGRGLLFSTEADTLTQALSQEWGQYTDILRMAFHHETITSSRTKDKQHIVIDEPQLGILVTCTPKQITYLLSPKQNENGSSSRDLFYCSQESLDWRNPFKSKEPIADRYHEIGQTVKQMFDLLVDRNKNRIQIVLTDEQQQAFNTHFKPLLPEQVGLYGIDFAAFIVRIALVAFRMMMILTTLRNFEQGRLADTQQQAFVCTDDDYQTAMTIIDCLVAHTGYVYNTLLHPSDDTNLTIQPMSSREQQLFSSLPDEFTTKQFSQLAKSNSIPLKTAQRYLGNFISRYQLVERTCQGHYAKTKH